ncbi:hypothetical protein Taro_023562 [Colocasia esculenta]|uniref:Uncharacterized protein n=1 Tax=Colocasia esculenta TaxID=4460 RepID=A0A843V4Z1_COLES|nr:hypothetical protein [Colocasia esculenta]
MRNPCCEKQETNKGAWSKQEDEKLINYIRTHGEGRWRTLPQAAGLLRCGKSCRLRWINYLRPDLKRGKFTEDEEDLIIKLHALLGNRWSLIAGRLPGRTDNEIKNYWNSHLRRKLMDMGLDPNNHRLGNRFPNLTKRRPHSPPNAAGQGTRSMHVCAHCAPRPDHDASDDRVTDEASCLEDMNVRALPDLNLSLSIWPQLSSPAACTESTDHHVRRPPEAGELKRNIPDETSSPTLLLFR